MIKKPFDLYLIILSILLFIIFPYFFILEAEQRPPVQLKALVDKKEIQIGDELTYILLVQADKNIEVEFPTLLSEQLGLFVVKDFGLVKRDFFNQRILKQWYRLNTYHTGEHTISKVEIRYRRKNQLEWHTLSANQVKVKVKSLLETDSKILKIRDIRGPKDIWDFKFFSWIMISLLLLFIIAAGIFFSLKKRFYAAKTTEPAHVIALQALEALARKNYLKQNQIKLYYTELSDIVRHYLENRFHLRAPHMSTEEFLLQAKEESSLTTEQKALLREFLTTCDLVKFAKHTPTEDEANFSFQAAKRMIEQTKEETEKKV